MKRFFFVIAFATALLGMTSCQQDGLDGGEGSEETSQTVARTVVIYMSAENNLGTKGFLSRNYNDIVNAAKKLPDNCNLLMYIDNYGENPYIVKADKGGAVTVKQYDTNFYSTDPDRMEDILKWCYSNYPSSSYGLVLWGHGTGWLVSSEDYCITRSYGLDCGDNISDETKHKWINIKDMAGVLATLPHLDYIFSDCCNMQSIEVDYELRSYADYFVGSPAEIAGYGAPYDYVVKDMFAQKDNVGRLIVDDYESHGYFYGASGLPLSVVKASEMENLANATRTALGTFMTDYEGSKDISLDSLIYYEAESSLANYAPISYDMRNFMRKYLDSQEYSEWNDAFCKAVVYSVHPEDIHTSMKMDWTSSGNKIDFNSFYLTDDNFGGVSMFIPHSQYDKGTVTTLLNPNKAISSMAWGKKIDWSQWSQWGK